MRIVFAGTPEVAIPGVKALLSHGHEVVGILTRTDAPLGRKKVLTPSPVAEYATAERIPLLKANKLGPEETAWVASLEADLGVVIAYGALLKTQLLNTPKLGWINVHFSTLPRWRGAAPVQRALMAGETTLGVSVFRLVEELDAGDLLKISEHEFALGTNATTALAELAEASTPTLLAAIELLEKDHEAGVAQTGETSYAHKLLREDAKLDLSQAASRVLSNWAGVTQEPGAWVEIDGETLKILDLSLPNENETALLEEALEEALKEGQVRLLHKKVYLGTGEGMLRVNSVQPAGKKAMEAAAWLRGRGGKATLR